MTSNGAVDYGLAGSRWLQDITNSTLNPADNMGWPRLATSRVSQDGHTTGSSSDTPIADPFASTETARDSVRHTRVTVEEVAEDSEHDESDDDDLPALEAVNFRLPPLSFHRPMNLFMVFRVLLSSFRQQALWTTVGSSSVEATDEDMIDPDMPELEDESCVPVSQDASGSASWNSGAL